MTDGERLAAGVLLKALTAPAIPHTGIWKMAPYNDENLYKSDVYVRMLQMQSVEQTYNEA